MARKRQTKPEHSNAALAFEREKWADELRLRHREIDARAVEATAKAREQENQANQISFNQREANRNRWFNPLVVAVFAAAVAGAGSAVVALLNGQAQRDAEEIKADQALILEAIKANSDPDKAAANLTFFVETGLIASEERRDEIGTFLKRRKPGEGPALPSAVLPLEVSNDRIVKCRPDDSLDMRQQTVASSDINIDIESCVNKIDDRFFHIFIELQIMARKLSPFVGRLFS